MLGYGHKESKAEAGCLLYSPGTQCLQRTKSLKFLPAHEYLGGLPYRPWLRCAHDQISLQALRCWTGSCLPSGPTTRCNLRTETNLAGCGVQMLISSHPGVNQAYTSKPGTLTDVEATPAPCRSGSRRVRLRKSCKAEDGSDREAKKRKSCHPRITES